MAGRRSKISDISDALASLDVHRNGVVAGGDSFQQKNITTEWLENLESMEMDPHRMMPHEQALSYMPKQVAE